MNSTSRKLFEIIVKFVKTVKADCSNNAIYRSVFRTPTLIDYLDNGLGGNAWIQIYDAEIILEAEIGGRQSAAMTVATTNPFPNYKLWEDYERTDKNIETCLRAVISSLQKRIADSAIRQVGLDDIPPVSTQHTVETDYYKLITEAVDRLLQLPKKAMLAAGLVYSDTSDLGQDLVRFWFPVDLVNKKLAFVTIFQNCDNSYGCHCETGDMDDASSTVFRKNVACRKDHAPTADDCSEEVAQNIYRGLIEVLARM